MDILDGTVTRDSYGVLVINTPTTPTDDVSFPQYTSTSCEAQGRPSSPATLPINQNEVQVITQGHAYKRHMPAWAAIKSWYIYNFDFVDLVKGDMIFSMNREFIV